MASQPARRRPRSADRGAALIEASLVLVVIVALIGGVTVVSADWGEATRTDQLATRAVRLAAKVVEPPATDLDVLALVGAGLGRATLERMLVYRPVGVSGEPAPGCAALRPEGTAPSGVSGWCNAFGPAHLAAVQSGVVAVTGCVAGSWEAAWCPASRRLAGDATSWVGVLLEVRPPDVPGWGGSSQGSRRSVRAVAALDPPPRTRP